MGSDDRKRAPTRATPPEADPTETMERLLSRRQLKIETGDVVLARVHGGYSITRESFQLGISGDGKPIERFATFEHGAAKGEELAPRLHARLFFLEHEGEPPFLLKDARRP
jgi:ribonuclease BN (tRNA processing enzyme)